MSDEERRAKPDIGKMVADMKQGLELASRVDDVAAEVRVLSDRFAEHTRADEEDKKQILSELDDIPDRTAEKVVRALRRRPDDTPAPAATPRPRVSRELAARAGATESSSADLVAFAPPAPAAPPAPPDDGPSRDVVEVTRGVASAMRLWGRIPASLRGLIVLAVGGVFSLGGCEALRRWAAYEQRQRDGAPPPPDMAVPRDLLAERPKPAPPPAPKPKSPPGRPRPDTKRDRVTPHYFPYATVECDGSPREPEHCNSDRKLR